MKNCPNCGAPITNYICEYCGTVFDNSEVATLYADSQKMLNQLTERQRQYEMEKACAELKAAISEQNNQIYLNCINSFKMYRPLDITTISWQDNSSQQASPEENDYPLVDFNDTEDKSEGLEKKKRKIELSDICYFVQILIFIIMSICAFIDILKP